MKSQSAAIPTRVPNGKAVLDACAHTNRFRMNTSRKSKPGKRVAVYAISWKFFE